MAQGGLDILASGSGWVAVNKPAGLAVIPGRAENTSLLEELAAQLGLPCTGKEDPRVRVVHRIDKETSGVVLFATTVDAQRHFSHQFQNNTVQKEYLAIVLGKVRATDGVVDEPLAPHPSRKDKMSISKQGKPALTKWVMTQHVGPFSLLTCYPKTGKTHQIRVHLAHIGHALAIDPLYGSPTLPPGKMVRGSPQTQPAPPPSAAAKAKGKSAEKAVVARERDVPDRDVDEFDPTNASDMARLAAITAPPPEGGLYLSSYKHDYHLSRGQVERPLISRLTLHAHKLTFVTPEGQNLCVEAAMPKDFRATITQFSRVRSGGGGYGGRRGR